MPGTNNDVCAKNHYCPTNCDQSGLVPMFLITKELPIFHCREKMNTITFKYSALNIIQCFSGHFVPAIYFHKIMLSEKKKENRTDLKVIQPNLEVI